MHTEHHRQKRSSSRLAFNLAGDTRQLSDTTRQIVNESTWKEVLPDNVRNCRSSLQQSNPQTPTKIHVNDDALQ
jgi:hypothetical protein